MCENEELISQALQGDSNAFAALIEQQYGKIYTLAYKWCGVREDAEDITQEVCVKIAQKLDSYNQDSAFSTWVYRITINTAKDFYRAKKRQKTREARYMEEEYVEGTPPTMQEDALIAQQLYGFIDMLPEKLKEAILLVFAEGLSHKEAADVLGCAETTISWRVHQARKKLQKLSGGGM